MSDLRLIGFLCSLVIVVFVVWQWRLRSYRRGEFLLGVLIAGGLATVSLYPSIVNSVKELFQVPTRIMALAILASLVLFTLLLYTLRELSIVRRSVGDWVRALARAEYQGSLGVSHEFAGKGEEGSENILVIIPAFEEEENLQKVLPELPTRVCGRVLQALVIVDGSEDHSAAVAREYAVSVTSHPIRRGQGDALRTGFGLALQNNAQITVTMDADGQHLPEEIERLVAPVIAGEAEFVMGSRFLGYYEAKRGARHVGILAFSALVSLLCGAKITRLHEWLPSHSNVGVGQVGTAGKSIQRSGTDHGGSQQGFEGDGSAG